MFRSRRSALGLRGNITQSLLENAISHIVRLEVGEKEKKKGKRFVILYTLLFVMTFQSYIPSSGYCAVGKRPLLAMSDAGLERNTPDQSNAIDD